MTILRYQGGYHMIHIPSSLFFYALRQEVNKILFEDGAEPRLVNPLLDLSRFLRQGTFWQEVNQVSFE